MGGGDFKRSQETTMINNKKKCIYYKPKSRVKYIKHKKQYISLKEYKKMMKGGVILPKYFPRLLKSITQKDLEDMQKYINELNEDNDQIRNEIKKLKEENQEHIKSKIQIISAIYSEPSLQFLKIKADNIIRGNEQWSKIQSELRKIDPDIQEQIKSIITYSINILSELNTQLIIDYDIYFKNIKTDTKFPSKEDLQKYHNMFSNIYFCFNF